MGIAASGPYHTTVVSGMVYGLAKGGWFFVIGTFPIPLPLLLSMCPLYACENKWEYLYCLQISTNYIPILNSSHTGCHFSGPIIESCHLKLLVCYDIHPRSKNGFKQVEIAHLAVISYFDKTSPV